MFDIGWSELLIIGVVALIVIGPKDLPEMFRTLGRFTAKARSMSRDFQRAMEAAAKETGVKDIARDVKNATSPKSLGLDAVRDAADRFEKWDPLKPTPPAKTSAAISSGAPAPEAIVAAAPMGPATAALAKVKADERAAALASVKDRIVAPAVAEVPSVARASKPKKTPAPRASDTAQAKPDKAKRAVKIKTPDMADPAPKPRNPRKRTSESSDE